LVSISNLQTMSSLPIIFTRTRPSGTASESDGKLFAPQHNSFFTMQLLIMFLPFLYMLVDLLLQLLIELYVYSNENFVSSSRSCFPSICLVYIFARYIDRSLYTYYQSTPDAYIYIYRERERERVREIK
jgi:hypothetical protein